MIPAEVTLKGIWAAVIAGAFAAVVGVCLFLLANTYLDLRFGPFHWEGWKPKAERFERERDACHTASKANADAQKAQKAAYEARYKDLAHEADEQVQRAQVDAMAATERYIAAHRVRGGQGGVSAPVAPADDHSAGSGDSASAAPELVAVSDEDIRICTTNTIRLEAVRDWAISLTNDPATP